MSTALIGEIMGGVVQEDGLMDTDPIGDGEDVGGVLGLALDPGVLMPGKNSNSDV